MPPYRTNIRRSRRFRSKRRTPRTRKAIIPRTLQPRTKLIKIRSVDYQNHTHASGAIAVAKIQHNSIDDPFTSLGTGQPLGYDQYKALYKKAIVLASRCFAEVHNNTSTAIMVGITAVPYNQGTTALTTYEHYMEAPNTKHRLLSPDVDRANMSMQMSTKKLLQIKNYKDNKTELEIDLNAETPPTNLSYWHLWSQPQDQITETTGTALQLTITMEYIVLLTDPIIPARSVET